MAGVASAWAMDTATRCSGVCPHTCPDLEWSIIAKVEIDDIFRRCQCQMPKQFRCQNIINLDIIKEATMYKL